MLEQTFVGLPGLKVIRDACCIPATRLADQARCSYTFFKRVENLKQDCSLAVLKNLCGILGCSGDDLLQVPTQVRLDEIRAAYHQREADRAREEARAAS